MEKTRVYDELTKTFRNVFEDEELQISPEMTANDVANWDSLSHMLLVSEIEKKFSIRFRLKELNKMKNVGDMIDIIMSKLN